MKLKFKVWSNVFFGIPLLLTIYYGLFIHSILISAVIIFSTFFHINNEKKWGILDQTFATGLITYNLYLCYLSDFRQPHFFLALLFVVVAFYFYFKQKKANYDLNHSLWHLSSVVITILCIFAYAT